MSLSTLPSFSPPAPPPRNEDAATAFLRWWWDDPRGLFGPGFHRRLLAFSGRVCRSLIPRRVRTSCWNLWRTARTPAYWGGDRRPTRMRLLVEQIFLSIPTDTRDGFVRWWRRATAPLTYNKDIETLGEVLRARLRIWAPVLVVVMIPIGALFLHTYAGWRARDFAEKALRNVEEGHGHLARLQAASAITLRSRDPRVLLARAMVESRVGNPFAPAAWEEIPPGTFLTREQIRERAKTMARFGSTKQQELALDHLERVGMPEVASGLRAERYATRSNLAKAIAEARKAVALGNNPEHKLALIRLLIWRYAPSPAPGGDLHPEQAQAVQEATSLVDSLRGTRLEQAALALGLSHLPLSPEKAREWADAAWLDPSPSNPALITAGSVMVKLGDATPEGMKERLRPVYADAKPGERAAFASWMLSNGWPQRALAVISAKDASQDPAAFVLRADALAAIKRWPVMRDMASSAANVPESLRLLTHALAARNLERPGEAKKAAQDAVRAAVREGTLAEALRSVDAMGETAAADAVLLELCGQAPFLERVFPVVRDRFSRRGQFHSLDRAFNAAASQATQVGPVKDYGRYLDLLAGRPVDLEVTAAAMEESPGNVDYRMTHALGLLLAGRGPEARSVFDDIDVFVYRLSPAQRVLSAAILAASGEPSSAAAAVRGLDPELLTKEEYLFLQRGRMSGWR